MYHPLEPRISACIGLQTVYVKIGRQVLIF